MKVKEWIDRANLRAIGYKPSFENDGDALFDVTEMPILRPMDIYITIFIMSWTRVWVHMVFATKYRQPFLDDSIRKKVFQHMYQNALEKDIFLDSVNGFTDHAHCLVALSREQTISKVAQLIKGESSFWINKNKLTKKKFVWQDDYWAVSVSERHVEKVRNYIKNQEAHHRRKSFKQENDRFMKKYGWEPTNPQSPSSRSLK